MVSRLIAVPLLKRPLEYQNINKIRQPLKKRLDTTRENLNRVNDIVAELEDQLEPLAEQSALAQDYLEQKGKFDLLDKTKTVRELDSNQAALKQIVAKQEKAQTMAAEYDEQAKLPRKHCPSNRHSKNGC